MRISDWSSDVCSSDLVIPTPTMKISSIAFPHSGLPNRRSVSRSGTRGHDWRIQGYISDFIVNVYTLILMVAPGGRARGGTSRARNPRPTGSRSTALLDRAKIQKEELALL